MSVVVGISAEERGRSSSCRDDPKVVPRGFAGRRVRGPIDSGNRLHATVATAGRQSVGRDSDVAEGPHFTGNTQTPSDHQTLFGPHALLSHEDP